MRRIKKAKGIGKEGERERERDEVREMEGVLVNVCEKERKR
jgi:hypothetical protein